MATDPEDGGVPDERDPSAVPDPQGHMGALPYDFRRPTVARTLARWWNPADPRLFTPKAFGAGWDVNLYWLVHPVTYLRARRTRRAGS